MSEVNDRSAMLEKLNAAYERAVKPDAAKDSFSDFAAENQYEKPVSDAVGGLYRDTEKEDARTVAKVEYDDDDDDDDYDIPRKKKGRVGKVIGIVLGALVLLTLVVATLIAEPWVKVPTDEYVEPNAYTAASPKTMGVGETYGFEDIALGENEIISEVKVNDEDILRAEGTAVTALGEYFGTGVYVTVKEKEVKPLSTHKDVMIFGKDLSEPYNKVRSALRNLIGVEKKVASRTETRVLALYEQRITVSGMDNATTATAEVVEGSRNNDKEIKIELKDKEDVMLSSDKPDIATFEKDVEKDKATKYYVNGEKTGEATLTAKIGFWKPVAEDVYAQYLESIGETAKPDATTDDTDDKKPEKDEHKNEIFVATRAITYKVKIA